MGKIVYIDTFSGISGDMLLGALIDAGFNVEGLKEEIDRMGIGAELHVERIKRGSVDAVDFKVSYDREKEKSRDYRSIRGMLEEKMSPCIGKDIALEIFAILAEAEAKVHGIDVEDVHFHEVGAVDSIVDIVGAGLGLGSLKPTKFISGPVPLGSGFVDTRHGKLPVPAPATMELLKGIPVRKTDVLGELVTPTGAAVLKAVVDDFGGITDMVVEEIGYGAGDKVFKYSNGDSAPPNLLRLIVGAEGTTAFQNTYYEDEVIVVTTNIDDMNPQFYEPLTERLFEAGALDVTLAPLIMKKGRPGTELTVMMEPKDCLKMTKIVLSESTTSGVRYRRERRLKLKRWIEEVGTSLGPVKVKFTSDTKNKLFGAHPEYEDIKAISQKSGLPVKEVYRIVIIDLERNKKGRAEMVK
ncbi:MAG: nickel pincer cofactor biosynthesis protein LarC [Deltaproteobacteria bacterium]|uniref:Putative nickel insertion protein n=1 Tax=Candidatus Zymogenus saltonus TaxID=2844893 RepID=A0A9D8KG63_9DELT|nr:nickel pincer cofactor biosynthesis protein LarC [Candidatus Zymogenus saltonus]